MFHSLLDQARADAAQQRDEAQGRALVTRLVSEYKLEISEAEKLAAQADVTMAREEAARERVFCLWCEGSEKSKKSGMVQREKNVKREKR